MTDGTVTRERIAPPPAADAPAGRSAGLALSALAAGNFAIGTGSLVVAGLLPGMAAGLGRSVAETGLAITAFAVAAALGGPLLAGPTSRFDRRSLLSVGLALLALASLLGAVAPDYPTLIASRVLAGLSAALFTPHAAGAATLLVGPEARGRAIAFVFAGFTASAILGVPLGTMAADLIGWRGTFAAVGLFALACLAALRATLPAGLTIRAVDGAAWKAVATRPALLLVMAATALQVLGQFVVFTFVAPVMAAAGIGSGFAIGLALAAFGLVALVGNGLAGRAGDRFGPTAVADAALALLTLVLALWPFAHPTLAPTLALFLAWGLVAFAINSVQQARLVGAAPGLIGATLPLNSAAVYAGQALGAALGAVVLARAGLNALAPVGAVALAAALAASLAARDRAAP